MADTIYMIHGMWGSGEVWGNWRSFLERRGHRCITPTLRHHGGSPADPPDPRLGATSLLDYAADLEAEVRGISPAPVLLGHSMGGLLAQVLAGRGLGRALALLTPASPAGILAIRPSVLRSFASGLLRWGFWRKPYRQTYGEAVYSMLHLLPEPARREIFATFHHESGRAAAEIGFWLLDLRRASRVPRQRVTCPVLVVGAAEDRITPASVVRRVAARYPQATYREFPGHAHWVLGEPGWEEIAAYCAEWFEGQQG